MNIQAIYHRPESSYCFATDPKTIVLRIRFAKGEQICKLSVCIIQNIVLRNNNSNKKCN